MKILIADDRPLVRQVLTNALKDKFVLFEAEDGIQALLMLYEHTPHIALLDATLPKFSGRQVLSVIRYNSMLTKIKVALISSNTSPSFIKESMHEYKSDAYFTTPFAMVEILHWINAQVLMLKAAVLSTVTTNCLIHKYDLCSCASNRL